LAAFASSPHLHSVGGQLPAPQLLTHQASEALLATLTHEAESRTVFTLGVYAAARPASSMSAPNSEAAEFGSSLGRGI
jgi:dihydrodipicolinate reductase